MRAGCIRGQCCNQLEAARLKICAEPQTGPAVGAAGAGASLGRAGVAVAARSQVFGSKFENRDRT